MQPSPSPDTLPPSEPTRQPQYSMRPIQQDFSRRPVSDSAATPQPVYGSPPALTVPQLDDPRSIENPSLSTQQPQYSIAPNPGVAPVVPSGGQGMLLSPDEQLLSSATVAPVRSVAFDQPMVSQPVQQQAAIKPARFAAVVRLLKRAKYSKRLYILAGALIIVGTAYVVGSALLQQSMYSRVLSTALTSALQTQQITEQTNDNGKIVTANYDLSNATQPIISSSGDISFNGSNYVLSGYGTPTDSFIQYTTLDPNMTTTAQQIVNKWVQIKAKGVVVPGVNTSLLSFAQPNELYASDILFFNLANQNLAQSYAKYFLSSGALAYHASNVKQVRSGGQIFYEYPVVFTTSKLQTWRQAVLRAQGFTNQSIRSDLAESAKLPDTKGILYVNKLSQQLVRMDISQGARPIISLYLDRNKTTIPSQPTPNLTWAQFLSLQNKLEQEAALKQANGVIDKQRQADLQMLKHYIDVYYNANGDYPSLADMNDQVWVSVHMQGINPDTFKDPRGSSLQLSGAPSADVFAYQPLSVSGKSVCSSDNINSSLNDPCVSYALTATLSNGQQYTLTNTH